MLSNGLTLLLSSGCGSHLARGAGNRETPPEKLPSWMLILQEQHKTIRVYLKKKKKHTTEQPSNKNQSIAPTLERSGAGKELKYESKSTTNMFRHHVDLNPLSVAQS